jgi:hypothetical protein
MLWKTARGWVMVLRFDFLSRGSLWIAALLTLFVAGCAAPQRTSDPSGAVRRTVPRRERCARPQ